jgi:hypothetical protein
VYLSETNKKLIFFSFTKCGKRRAEKVLSGAAGRGLEDATSGKREEVGKGCESVYIVQILCTNVCKWKNKTC